MENFFGVDEDPSESLMGDAPSMVSIMKAHKAKQEKEDFPSPKKRKKRSSWILPLPPVRLPAVQDQRLCLRLNPSIQKLIHTQTNVQSPLLSCSFQRLNRIYIKPEYLPNTLAIMKELALTKVFIHATTVIVIMEHKPAQWSALISIGYNSELTIGCRFCLTKCWWQPRYWASHM